MKMKFVDSFWDPDITSTRGSDAIIRRMKDGRKVCKELIEYLSERSKAEAAFAKALKNAARKLENNIELGDLGSSISALKAETEHMSVAHETAGTDMSALSIELSNFNKDQETVKAQRGDLLQKATANKLSSNTKVVTLKEKYVQRCRDRDSADDAYKTARNSVATQTKELQKAEKNKEKGYDNMQHADTAYKSALDTLEGARKAWESTMTETCVEFQKMEMERIYLTRNILWKVTNVDSQACVTQDNCAEKIRTVLEKCDLETDLQVFIDNCGVGRDHPERVAYQSYYERRTSTSNPPTRVDSGGTRPRQPLPHIPKTYGGGGGPRSRPPGPPKGPPPRQEQLISFGEGDEDGSYASISTATSGKRMANVVRGHDAKKPFELSVRVGDQVEVLNQNKGYLQIKVGNRVGAIPETCVNMPKYM